MQRHIRTCMYMKKVKQRTEVHKWKSYIQIAYISRTQPKALSASGSFFIARETFIQVGAIFFKDSYFHFPRMSIRRPWNVKKEKAETISLEARIHENTFPTITGEFPIGSMLVMGPFSTGKNFRRTDSYFLGSM